MEPWPEDASRILGRPLVAAERDRFEKYLVLLTRWQKSHRMVGSTERPWLLEHVVLDSLLFLKVIGQQCRRVMDLGAGAGIPGIPMKIVSPDTEMTLVEARRRRASFLTTVVRELPLEHTRVMESRGERLVAGLRGSMDAVVMRCSGDLRRMLGLGLEFVVPGGLVVASGPPEERQLVTGEWVSVPGREPGSTRRFAVARAAL